VLDFGLSKNQFCKNSTCSLNHGKMLLHTFRSPNQGERNEIMHYVKEYTTWKILATRNLNAKICIKPPFFCVPPGLTFKTPRHEKFEFLATCCYRYSSSGTRRCVFAVHSFGRFEGLQCLHLQVKAVQTNLNTTLHYTTLHTHTNTHTH
jgi:hypothetical protein